MNVRHDSVELEIKRLRRKAAGLRAKAGQLEALAKRIGEKGDVKPQSEPSSADQRKECQEKLLQQSKQFEALGRILEKTAKTDQEKASVKVAFGLGEVAKMLAETLEKVEP